MVSLLLAAERAGDRGLGGQRQAVVLCGLDRRPRVPGMGKARAEGSKPKASVRVATRARHDCVAVKVRVLNIRLSP
jgi:hypothetical protein